ncbi:hypothetical protein [Haloarcula litorea]|uniref:hypothetical protein n=1 Tax=Haloarcula litorea TaxID=3032579 RepID=UPI0023E8D195|nr:hypothetical protein [Halomicroarcula sp. GDY20]
MDYPRAATFAVAGVVVAAALVSGPLVPGVTLTSERDVTYGGGNATVASVSLPDRATLDSGSYGQDGYYLAVPPATVRFAALDGSPSVTYRLQIPDLGYARSTVHFLTGDVGGSYEATLRPDNLATETVRRDRYEGTVSVVVEDDAGRRRVAAGNVTVEVIE